MLFSIIVPVFNRPKEIDELLESLTKQTCTDFEVLVIEDGSVNRCQEIVHRYQDRLEIRYFEKPNSGQGFSRNYGFERALGEYLVVFDSDCLIPPHYFETVKQALRVEPFDAWGGPDRAHSSFTRLQRAINYSMTSPLTTGGIRGDIRMADTWHPRSFNMGIHRTVYRATGGYERTRKGEDLDLSIRIREAGYRIRLLSDAWVYHRRRDTLGRFVRQLHFFGRARVSIKRKHPDSFRWIHLLPTLFLFYLLTALISVFPFKSLWPLGPYFVWAVCLFLHAGWRKESLPVSLFAIVTSTLQLVSYGTGVLQEWIRGEP
ncbi:MAG: glycosyltransferase [Balneolaceae bacterium]